MISKTKNLIKGSGENMKYIYKVGFYESKRKTISHTDMYFEKLEDCLWAYEKYNSKNDEIEHPWSGFDWFDIQIIRVNETDMNYESAVSNSALRADARPPCPCCQN